MSDRSRVILLVICLAIILLPLVVIRHPPLTDYPNHLARLLVLTHPDDPELSRSYQIDWSLLPNLGFDLVGVALAQVMPVELAGRVFIAIAFVFFASASVVLHRALFGRLSILPMIAGVLVFNRVVQLGFLSYLLGIGLALWLFAGWLMCRDRSATTRFVVLQLSTLVLFICHLYALAVFAMLVTLSAASAGWRQAPGTVSGRLRGAFGAVVPDLVPFVAPFVLLLLASKTGSAGNGVEYKAFYLKFVLVPMSLMIDMSAVALVLAEVAFLPAILARLGGGRAVHPAVVWPLVTMALIYLPMPDRLLSSWNADWRLLVPMAVVLIAAAEDPFRSRRACAAIGALVVALNATAAWSAWTFWRGGDRMVAELHDVLGELPRGALLIPWIPGEQEYRNSYRPPAVLHAASWAVIERGALVPTVFANRGQQPIRFTDAALVTRKWYETLQLTGTLPPEAGRPGGPEIFILEVRTGYDVTAPLPALAVPVTPVGHSGRFTLYRMRPAAIEKQ